MPKKNTDNYTVSRKFAAEILDVSVRTLDRYVKKDKISSVRRGRQLFFSEQDLLDFRAHQLAQDELQQAHEQRYKQQQNDRRVDSRQARKSPSGSTATESSRQGDFIEVEQAQAREHEAEVVSYQNVDAEFADIRDSLLRRSPEESIFKKLYEKAEGDMKVLRQQLEVANYNVGKLEAQVASMVPLLTFKKQKQELLELSADFEEKNADIEQLEQQIKLEKVAKNIYAAFLFFMMALLPLLVILRLVA